MKFLPQNCVFALRSIYRKFPGQSTNLRSYKLMKCHINTEYHVPLVELAGDIDGKTAQEIQEQIFPELEAASRILLDMRKVNYMSSAGLRMLLLIYRQVQKKSGQIVLVGVSEEIKDVMSVTGFLKHFPVCDTIEDGLNVLQEEA